MEFQVTGSVRFKEQRKNQDFFLPALGEETVLPFFEKC